MDLNTKLSLKKRILFTGFVTILVWVNLIWDYLHKGVPSHYFLQREDLPEISNPVNSLIESVIEIRLNGRAKEISFSPIGKAVLP